MNIIHRIKWVALCMLLFSQCSIPVYGQADGMRTVEIRLTKDFGAKLKLHDESEKSLQEFFKSYGASFPDGSQVKLEFSSSSEYRLITYNQPGQIESITAICNWFNLYSAWFSAEMIYVTDSDVAEARAESMGELYNQTRGK